MACSCTSCSGGCGSSCVGCSGGCGGNCVGCGGTCYSVCAPGCGDGCTGCSGCSSCSGCSGCGGCDGSCSGNCGGCGGLCSYCGGCAFTCSGNCTDECNNGCTATSATADYVELSNGLDFAKLMIADISRIKTLTSLIANECSRRNVTLSSATRQTFGDKDNIILASDFQAIRDNIYNCGYSPAQSELATAPQQGETIFKSTVENYIKKAMTLYDQCISNH